MSFSKSSRQDELVKLPGTTQCRLSLTRWQESCLCLCYASPRLFTLWDASTSHNTQTASFSCSQNGGPTMLWTLLMKQMWCIKQSTTLTIDLRQYSAPLSHRSKTETDFHKKKFQWNQLLWPSFKGHTNKRDIKMGHLVLLCVNLIGWSPAAQFCLPAAANSANY